MPLTINPQDRDWNYATWSLEELRDELHNNSHLPIYSRELDYAIRSRCLNCGWSINDHAPPTNQCLFFPTVFLQAKP